MPVFITRADIPLGIRLVDALVNDGADVRAFATGHGDIDALRAAGARVAIGELDDSALLDAAMTHAHTVVVLGDPWLVDPARHAEEVAGIAHAAVAVNATRLILVSIVGADPAAAVDVLAAHGRAEHTVQQADLQSLVVRTDGVADNTMADLLAAVTDHDEDIVAPVAPDRLVMGLVTLDAARSQQREGHARFHALGEPATVAQWSQRLRGPDGHDRSTGRRPQARQDEDHPTSHHADHQAGDHQPWLVGRRWLPPAVVAGYRQALASRGGPSRDGADLWSLG